MKRSIFGMLLIVTLSFVLLLAFMGVANAEKCKLTLNISFTDYYNTNSKIKIYVDKNLIDTVSSKEPYKTVYEVEQGSHTIWLVKSIPLHVYQGMVINITGDSTINCSAIVMDNYRLFIDQVSPAPVKILTEGLNEANSWCCYRCGQYTSLLFQYCSHCGSEMPQNKTKLVIRCKHNFIFSRYGLDIFVDNVYYSRIDDGGDKAIECRFPSGKHRIRIQKTDDSNLFTEIEINVVGNATIMINVERKRNEIKINDNKTTAYELTGYIEKFTKTPLYNEQTLSFDVDLCTFECTDIWKTIKGKRTKITSSGRYSIDKNDVITLIYNDGRIERYNYQVTSYLYQVFEVLYPLDSNGMINKEGIPGKDILGKKQ